MDLRGKILRINPDGSIPAGNLFPGGVGGRPEIFTMGNRNPFRIAVDPLSGRLFWGEVGPDAFADGPRGPRGLDEVNFADAPGNYGWPYCIGMNLPYADYDFSTDTPGPPFSCDGLVPALVAYDYFTTTYLALGDGYGLDGQFVGRTATAGAFYRVPPAAPFALPAPFADSLLMTDWTRDIVAAVRVDATGGLEQLRRFLPWERFLRPIDLELGADGAVYVLEYGSGYFGDNDDARLSRVEHAADGALTPVAVVQASATTGSVPLVVTFTAEGSRAPGDRIKTWLWDVDGDGRPDARGPKLRRRFKKNGRFAVALTVVGASGRKSFPAVVEIVVGNQPPQVTI
jgi:cytochrome c